MIEFIFSCNHQKQKRNMAGLKRKRDVSEENDDCIPISKRINSLHIENQTPGHCSHSQNPDNSGGNVDCSSSHDAMTSDRFPQILGQNMMTEDVNNPRCYTNDEMSHINRIFSDSCARSLSSDINSQSMSTHESPLLNYTGISHESMNGSLPQQDLSSVGQNHYHHSNQSIAHYHNADSSSSNDQFPINSIISNINMSSETQNSFLQRQYSADHFHCEQIPSGPYQPELGMTENPHYYSINQTLYEAHLSKSRRL